MGRRAFDMDKLVQDMVLIDDLVMRMHDNNILPHKCLYIVQNRFWTVRYVRNSHTMDADPNCCCMQRIDD